MVQIFLQLLNRSITAVWLILAVIFIRFLLKKAPKRFRLVLWALTAVRLVCPVSFESSFSVMPRMEAVQMKSLHSENISQNNSGISGLDEMKNPVMQGTLAIREKADTSHIIWTQIAGGVWGIGVIVLFTYSIISFLRLKRKVSSSIRIKGNVWICDEISTPFILGSKKPKIYLPSGISQNEYSYVIRHEQAHLQRGDHLWKPLGFCILVLHWFNPFVWLAYILFCRDIELACDEHVIRNMDIEGRKEYSKVLLALSVKKYQVSACPLAFGEVGVKQRIKQILNYKKAATWIAVTAIAACIIVACCFLTNQKKEVINFNDISIIQAAIMSNEKEGAAAEFLTLNNSEKDELWSQLKKVKVGKKIEVSKDTELAYTLTVMTKEHGEFIISSMKDSKADEIMITYENQGYSLKDKKFCRYLENLWGGTAPTESIHSSEGNNDNNLKQRSFEQVKEYLSTFTNDSDSLEKSGCFVITYRSINGIHVWNDFCEAINDGKPAELVIAQFTTEGDAILDYLSYDGSGFYHVCDSTRDNYAGTGDKYYEENYPYIKVFDRTATNGDKTKSVVLTDIKDLTYKEYEKTIYSDNYTGENSEIRLVAFMTDGNENAEVTGNETWHEEDYRFDMSTVLISRKKISKIVVVDAYTENKKIFAVTDGSNAFHEILDAYYNLNVILDESMDGRIGCHYYMELLDENGKLLQTVTPYKDAVKLDYRMYEGSKNGTATQLLLKLDELVEAE